MAPALRRAPHLPSRSLSAPVPSCDSAGERRLKGSDSGGAPAGHESSSQAPACASLDRGQRFLFGQRDASGAQGNPATAPTLAHESRVAPVVFFGPHDACERAARCRCVGGQPTVYESEVASAVREGAADAFGLRMVPASRKTALRTATSEGSSPSRSSKCVLARAPSATSNGETAPSSDSSRRMTATTAARSFWLAHGTAAATTDHCSPRHFSHTGGERPNRAGSLLFPRSRQRGEHFEPRRRHPSFAMGAQGS